MQILLSLQEAQMPSPDPGSHWELQVLAWQRLAMFSSVHQVTTHLLYFSLIFQVVVKTSPRQWFQTDFLLIPRGAVEPLFCASGLWRVLCIRTVEGLCSSGCSGLSPAFLHRRESYQFLWVSVLEQYNSVLKDKSIFNETDFQVLVLLEITYNHLLVLNTLLNSWIWWIPPPPLFWLRSAPVYPMKLKNKLWLQLTMIVLISIVLGPIPHNQTTNDRLLNRWFQSQTVPDLRFHLQVFNFTMV